MTQVRLPDGLWYLLKTPIAIGRYRLMWSMLRRLFARSVFQMRFVVDYEEDFTDETGAGTFQLLIKQKKDKMANLKFEGGFSGE